jgi:glc operon protein GlcG
MSMTLRLVEANRAIEAAQAKARNLALNISVTVCDADGRLVAFQRMDGTFAEASRTSIGKAIASVSFGRPSGDVSNEGPNYFGRGARVVFGQAATVIGEGTPLIRRPGGLPISRGGQIDGAVGVDGAYSDEQDVECAIAAINALRAEPDLPCVKSSSRGLRP